jgi:hypothetical protein
VSLIAVSRHNDAVRPAPQLREVFDDAEAGFLPVGIDNVREDCNTLGSDTGYEALKPLLGRAHNCLGMTH